MNQGDSRSPLDLHRESADRRKRVQALISSTIQELDSDPDSPFFERILLADSQRTETRCISLAAMFGGLERPGLYYESIDDNLVFVPGPFWDRTDDQTIQRSIALLNGWFSAVRNRVPDWWEAGAGLGGGLAMNDGVTICLGVLRSVIEHFANRKPKLTALTTREIIEVLAPYANALGDHLASMTSEDRLAFRALRGNQGQAAGIRHAQRSIRTMHGDFDPPGLAEFLEREQARTNDQAASLITALERLLSKTVVEVLKEQVGTANDAWWYVLLEARSRDVLEQTHARYFRTVRELIARA